MNYQDIKKYKKEVGEIIRQHLKVLKNVSKEVAQEEKSIVIKYFTSNKFAQEWAKENEKEW